MEILELFARCGLYMSLLVIMLYPLIALFGKRYSPHSIYVAWIIMLIGFVIPFRPRFTYYTSVEAADVSPAIVAPYPGTGRPIPNQPIPVDASAIHWTQILLLIWLIGFVAILGYHLVRNYLFYRTVKRWWNPPGDSRLLDIFDHEKALISSADNVKIMLCNTVHSPMLIGIIRPVILLPEASIASDNIHLIIRHELIHYRRKDLWVKLLQVIAISLHWYNPVVYLLIRTVNTYCEISCDAEVLKSENRTECAAYCKAILEYAHDNSIVPILSSSYSAGKRFLEKRFEAIMNPKAKRMGIVIAAIVFVAALITGATWAAEPKIDEATYDSADSETNIADDKLTEEHVRQGNHNASSSIEPPAPSSSAAETRTKFNTREPSTASPSLFAETASTGNTSVSIASDYVHSEKAYSDHNEVSFTDKDTVMKIEAYFQNLKVSSIEMPSRPEIGSYLFTVSINSDEGTSTYRLSAPQKDGTLYCKDMTTSEWSSMTGWIQVSEADAYDYIKNLFENTFSILWPTIDTRGTTYKGHTGNGLDFIGAMDTDIYAVADGTVVIAAYDENTYGRYLVINHEGGFQSLYAHCNVLDVSEGETVRAGQKIAAMGETGPTTGCHLHFELKQNGIELDPYLYFIAAN